MNNQPVLKRNFIPQAAIISLCMFISLFFSGIALCCPAESTYLPVFLSGEFWMSSKDYSGIICLALIALFVLQLAVTVYGIISAFWKKKAPTACAAISLMITVVMTATILSFNVIEFLGNFILIISSAAAVAALTVCLVISITDSFRISKAEKLVSSEKSKKVTLLILAGVSLFAVIMLFYTPFYSYVTNLMNRYSVIPLAALSAGKNSLPALLVFSALFGLSLSSFISFLRCFTCFSGPILYLAERTRSLIIRNACITGGYFAAGVVYCCVRNVKTDVYHTSSYIPFIITAIVAIVLSFVIRNIEFPYETVSEKTSKFARAALLLYGSLISIITVASCFSDILKVTMTEPTYKETLRLNGFKILQTYKTGSEGFQLLAFLLLAIIFVTAALLLAAIVSNVSRSKVFHKIALTQIISGSAFTLLIGLFGKYYEIVQKMNKETMITWINSLTGLFPSENIAEYIETVEYKVTSQSYYWFFAAFAIALFVIVRKPYTRALLAEEQSSDHGRIKVSMNGPMPSPQGLGAPSSNITYDPCPAFTELDKLAPSFQNELIVNSRTPLATPSLPSLVSFIEEYARRSRLHLIYSKQDIAAFIAGLGSTRLSILQGMSGTGKTSLPKIFTEAIMGNCELVEVESSWRDKHELLGYYNEFSKTYTPKKFTRALYKAKLNPDVPTFIVLDEMNLSRIEYYFSDFLSLMEHEEDKREIRLVNVKLFRIENELPCEYSALSSGDTLKIPPNVWFIGTANRDESTFEISDKVYDRAHTMNFNKRAPRILSREEPISPAFLSYAELNKLLDDARRGFRFNVSSSTLISNVEEILAPYNISFGNRIANQIESFVSIYCSCFTPSAEILHEALETILLSKVVSKLELRSVDDKEELAAKFNDLKLYRCAEFVMKLNED